MEKQQLDEFMVIGHLLACIPGKNIMHRHAIQPIQQFAYTTGKNASDSPNAAHKINLMSSS
jgi:hypothetical protein